MNLSSDSLKIGDSLPAEPSSLSSRAKRFLRLVAMGWSSQDARFEVGFSSSRASILLNSTLGCNYLDQLEKELVDKTIEKQAEQDTRSVQEIVRKRFEQEAEESVDRMIALRDGSDEKVAFSAAKDILDRAGFKSKDQIEVESKIIATDGLLEALDRARKLGEADASAVAPTAPAEPQAGEAAG